MTCPVFGVQLTTLRLKAGGLSYRAIARACLIGKETVREYLGRAAKRLFGIPDFRFYALADAIKAYLFGQKRGLHGCFSSRDSDTGQRWLFSS